MFPLTAQHASDLRSCVGLAIRVHSRLPRSSRHTSHVNPPSCHATGVTPNTTIPGRVLSHALAPSREVLHTRASLLAPTKPLYSAMIPHISTRAATREPAHSAFAFAMGRGRGICGARQPVMGETRQSPSAPPDLRSPPGPSAEDGWRGRRTLLRRSDHGPPRRGKMEEECLWAVGRSSCPRRPESPVELSGSAAVGGRVAGGGSRAIEGLAVEEGGGGVLQTETARWVDTWVR